LLNFSFIPNELNNSIKDADPSDYFKDFKKTNPKFEETLKSHLIPFDETSGIWTDDYALFLSQRNEIIFKEIEELIGTINPMTALIENKPLESLETLELNVRELINEVLSDQVGDQYTKLFPQGIQERLKERLGQRAKRHPYEENITLSGYELLSFCDVMDYAQIIVNQKTWQYFSGYFGSLAEVEKHFLNLKEYRNSLMHNRPMNTVERKQGEASAEWLSKVVQHASGVAGEQVIAEEDEVDDTTDSSLIDTEKVVTRNGVNVTGVFQRGDKIKVLKGSFGKAANAPSFTTGKSSRRLKDRLIKKGILVIEEERAVFAEDYVFDSTSAAASVIVSHAASGPNFWELQ
jgi:hypothetical protein